ncbi:hypothetical protein Zmor_010895 [Zophobas morio]|uniref:Protein hunchback n=1 Tax=Zophobas morio TaxID=2755281 RepID=A0AA38IQB8_9CUCU|nr:hypothetical protein Zmor_010895 [Zophobas morio]
MKETLSQSAGLTAIQLVGTATVPASADVVWAGLERTAKIVKSFQDANMDIAINLLNVNVIPDTPEFYVRHLSVQKLVTKREATVESQANVERRSATVTDDDSPIIAAQTRKISTAHRRQTSTVALLYFIRHWSSSHFNGETHDVKSYYCQDCNYRTVLTLLFKQHLQDRHGIKKEQEQYYTWKKCPFKTKPNYHLKSHINGRHSDGQDIKRVTCQECPFKTKYNHSLKMHIHVKHLLLVDKEIKWYYCEKCSYKGKFSWELKKHINALHLEEDDIKWYECKECQFKTKHKPYLNIHINPRHLNGADIK